MGKLWQRSRDDQDQPRLQAVDLSALKINAPTVIFLTGFFTYDDTPEYISGALKTMEELVDKAPGDTSGTNVYAWSHAGLKEIFNLAAYDGLPSRRASHNGFDLAKAVIMPLVAEGFAEDASGKVSGKPLPLDVARQNLRNVTLFGYSAGTITAQECYNASLLLMKQVGFSDKDAKAALHEVVLISAGVMSRPKQEKDRFTTLYLEANNDVLVRWKNRLWEPLRAMFSWATHKLRIDKLSDRSLRISATVNKQNFEVKKKKDGQTFREKFNGLVPNWFPVKSYHELPRYVTEDENLSSFARIVKYGMANALARDRLLAPLELLSAPPGVDGADAAAFKTKVDKAASAKKRWFNF